MDQLNTDLEAHHPADWRWGMGREQFLSVPIFTVDLHTGSRVSPPHRLVSPLLSWSPAG